MRIEPGLCGSCRWARIIVSGKGSTFQLCTRSSFDPAYPKYPRLPVLRCAGFEAQAGPAEGGG
jgi:hypothetical protein